MCPETVALCDWKLSMLEVSGPGDKLQNSTPAYSIDIALQYLVQIIISCLMVRLIDYPMSLPHNALYSKTGMGGSVSPATQPFRPSLRAMFL